MKVYGIPNCDTVKKAQDWFKLNGVEYEFHDYKKLGITKDVLHEWSKKLGWEKLLNKKSTTWRTLPAEEQQKVTNEQAAIELMMEQPSIIKRPVTEVNGKVWIGFNDAEYSKNFKKKQRG